MKNDDFQKLTSAIQEKIGKDASGLIADDLGKLISDNAQMNTAIETRDTQIEKLKQDKENLITANGNLLQQVAMGEDLNKPKEKEKEEEKKPFNFKSVFDEKGHFKK